MDEVQVSLIKVRTPPGLIARGVFQVVASPLDGLDCAVANGVDLGTAMVSLLQSEGE